MRTVGRISWGQTSSALQTFPLWESVGQALSGMLASLAADLFHAKGSI